MRERVEVLVGRMHPRDVGHDLPLGLRADPALGRRAAGLHARLHHLRRGRLGPADQAVHGRAGHRPQAVPAAGDQAPDLRRQEPAAGRRRLPAEDERLLRADRRRGLRALRAAHPRHERHGLRRPAVPVGEPVPALPRGAGALPAQLQARAGGRVPGHQPRPVPVAAPAGRRAPQPGGGRRRQPVDLRLPPRRHPQHPGVRARLPRRRGGQARAELPLHPDHPGRRQRGHQQQPRPDREAPVDPERQGRADPHARDGGRALRGALRGRPDREARGGRAARATTWPSSTAPTPRAACSRTRWCATASATRSSAAPASTSAPRSRTRWPT